MAQPIVSDSRPARRPRFSGREKNMLNRKDLHLIIKDRLSIRTPVTFQERDSSRTHAAVLIPLFMENGEHKLLFTQRTNRVEHHKGQISFPGGRMDQGDDTFEETALREVHEEIGLSRDDVEILGRIDDTPTVSSNYVIHPFVGLIPYPYKFRLSPREVKRLIQVPFRLFLEDNHLSKRDSIQIDGIAYQTPAYEYNGDLIWGATAKIIENLVDILCGKNI